MDGKEKLISVIRKVIKRERQEEIQIGEMVSDTTIKIKDLEIDKGTFIKIALGNKEFTINKGGFNIFGAEFGDYPQDIIVEQIKY